MPDISQGHFAALIYQPLPRQPFPPPTIITNWMAQLVDGSVRLETLTDGRVAVRVADAEGNTVNEVVSPPLKFLAPEDKQPFYTFAADWNEGSMWLQINDVHFTKYSPRPPYLALDTFATPAHEVFSVQHPDAVAACQKWIDNRKSMFSRQFPRPDRRTKTIDEQADDLRRSIYCLGEFAIRLAEGKTHLIGTVAGELRACIYWTNDDEPNRNLNPLLLRMAGKADLPLPVYTYLVDLQGPMFGSHMHVVYRGADSAYMQSRAAADIIVDFQEWLKQDFMSVGRSPGVVMSTLKVIGEAAYTYGASHYDDNANEYLDVLSSMTVNDMDELAMKLAHTAALTADLGLWVIHELEGKGVIVSKLM